MRHLIVPALAVVWLGSASASAADLSALAECTTKIFSEINRSRAWSGKAPAGCAARVAVSKREDRAVVTAWQIEPASGGWVKTAFSAAMGYGELAGEKGVAAASRDIQARAKRLERCMTVGRSGNEPRECRSSVGRDYIVDERVGVEKRRLFWLDDNGRHTVVELTMGDTAAVPIPPANLSGDSEPLPPGVDFHILLR